MKSAYYLRVLFAMFFCLIAAMGASSMATLIPYRITDMGREPYGKLPIFTNIYFYYYGLGYLLPAFALFLIFFEGKRSEKAMVIKEACILALILAGFAWSFGSIIAFIAPYRPLR
jgi:hypothetical protein